MAAAHDRQKSYADKRRKPLEFQICLADESLVIPLEELHINEQLRFDEEPLEIMDREVKTLKRSKIPIVRVRWNSKHESEFTWEREDQIMHDNYDWGVHLEDAIIGHTQMGLMAEIIKMIKAEKRETVAAADQQGSAFALMAIGEASSSLNEGIGSGTNAIPPPVNGTFVNGPVDIDLSFIDEEFYFDECSEDKKLDGVVSEEMINQPIMNKNIVNNRDNCILTESDVIQSNDKLKKTLYGDFKTIKQASKETFANKLEKNFQENIDKHYSPKIQSTSGKTSHVVPQSSSDIHQNKPSISETSEPYRRTFKERRSSFHYRMFGHILVNCPYKNKEKRCAVPQ
ncbi:hypothetical protein L1987_53257 [Smallanthus sonchifolius]|uniref:Uncharacterized protein n=1 Tax=Smallanthus sonchifolius TaxID=185202 RepID=A0ACB9EVU5_9ASTR|nr:hypothetical protein L1987_53257 [Smallanthus sonchifolius]